MTNEQVVQLIDKVDGLQAAALADTDGCVEVQSDGFDADLACAVAAIGQMQLEELGRRLGAGRVCDWAVTAAQSNLYVVRSGEKIVVAIGIKDEKPTKITEKISSLLESISES